MRKYLVFWFCLAFLGIGILGCDKHADVPLGTEGVLFKSAGYRTEGGGIESKAYPAGQRVNIGSWTAESEMKLVPTAPFVIQRKNLQVRMINWKDLEMDFDVSVIICVKPGMGYVLQGKYGSNWKDSILETPFDSVCQQAISVQMPETIRDRGKIATEIKTALEAKIAQRGEEAKNCLLVLGVTLNNTDYPDEIYTAKGRTATAKYRNELIEVEAEVKDYEGRKNVIDAETRNLSYTMEAGRLDPNLLYWQNIDVVRQAMKSENEMVIIFTLDEQGNPSYLKALAPTTDNGKAKEKE